MLDTKATYGRNFTVQHKLVRWRCSLHTSTDDWLHIWRETFDEVIGIASSGFKTPVEGIISDVGGNDT